MNGPKARLLLLAGVATHVASLLLPFDSYKCDAPQPFFSLECAFPGYVYFLIPLIRPAGHGLLVLLVCAWALAVVGGLLTAVTNRLQRIGFVASLLVLPTFVTAMVAVPPGRWLGPIGSGVGAMIMLAGGILGIASRDRARSPGKGTPSALGRPTA
jgi:hypothetical protein